MTFDEAFHELLGHEGGYANHPDDPGGETMWGVTKRVAKANGYFGAMKELPVEMAKAIYKKDYWDSVKADALDESIRYSVFDAAVNSGPRRALEWLEESGGNPVMYNAIRLQFMTDLPTWKTFGKGWARRIVGILRKLK
jgi:lysozyme family protein